MLTGQETLDFHFILLQVLPNKCHTRRHLVAVDETKRVLILSKAREGKLHDKRFHDENDIAESIPDEIPIEVDLEFLGLQKEYDNIHLPLLLACCLANGIRKAVLAT